MFVKHILDNCIDITKIESIHWKEITLPLPLPPQPPQQHVHENNNAEELNALVYMNALLYNNNVKSIHVHSQFRHSTPKWLNMFINSHKKSLKNINLFLNDNHTKNLYLSPEFVLSKLDLSDVKLQKLQLDASFNNLCHDQKKLSLEFNETMF